MATKSLILSIAVLSIALFGMTNAMGKREISEKASSAKENKEEFEPFTGTRKFAYQVSDNIKGADQNREETWNNGNVSGHFVAPHRDGKFLKTYYIADKNGYQVVKTEELTREQAMQNNAAQDSAKVDISNDHMDPVAYSVTKEELEKAQKAQKEKAQKAEQTKTQ